MNRKGAKASFLYFIRAAERC